MAMWSPWHGCKKISDGCKYCYIHKGDFKRGIDTSNITKNDSKFYAPIAKKKNGEYKIPSGSLVYLCFSSDFFIADAFEVFTGYSLKGEQGQFFTPKNVVRLMVNAVDPKLNDIVIDPSCGSGSFLVESLKYLWNKVDAEAKELEWEEAAVVEEKKEIGIKNIRGIEKDSFLTKVAKSYMALLGDGKGGIFCEESCD